MIRVLPPDVVNQIAAGEVIERPFSVVKELVENSLDAGATRVHVELADGGRALIRVHDDGGGLTEEDMALAFVGHATSKLASADDLEHIASLGFRGEALASIGSISRAQITSRPPDQPSGFLVTCAGADVGEVRPSSSPPGTTVEIRDLFFNTPARRRFLRTPQAERARIHDMLVRLALAHPGVDFTLRADGRDVLRLPGGEDLLARIGRAFGDKVARGMREVSVERDDYRVTGWVGSPDAARRDSTLELLYINGRNAKDRSATFSIRQAYRGHLMPRRFPVYVLHLAMPPAEVDVNVHPTKAEVRFRDGRKVAGLLHAAVHGVLATHGRVATEGAALTAAPELPAARSGFPDLPGDLFGRPRARVDASSEVREVPPPAAAPEVREPERPHPFAGLEVRRFLQVLDLYLVLEVGDGMMVVDQHALHERVLYEKLTREDRERGTAIQRLLMPEVVDLTATDKAYLLEAREALAEEGFLVEDFGGNSVAVQGIPAVLNRARPAALVESFLTGGDEGDARPRAREAILERFHSRACRSSVMRGDRMTEEEIGALLADAATLAHPHNCPHGRPTVLTFSRDELEKFFKRKV